MAKRNASNRATKQPKKPKSLPVASRKSYDMSDEAFDAELREALDSLPPQKSTSATECQALRTGYNLTAPLLTHGVHVVLPPSKPLATSPQPSREVPAQLQVIAHESTPRKKDQITHLESTSPQGLASPPIFSMLTKNLAPLGNRASSSNFAIPKSTNFFTNSGYDMQPRRVVSDGNNVVASFTPLPDMITFTGQGLTFTSSAEDLPLQPKPSPKQLIREVEGKTTSSDVSLDGTNALALRALDDDEPQQDATDHIPIVAPVSRTPLVDRMTIPQQIGTSKDGSGPTSAPIGQSADDKENIELQHSATALSKASPGLAAARTTKICSTFFKSAPPLSHDAAGRRQCRQAPQPARSTPSHRYAVKARVASTQIEHLNRTYGKPPVFNAGGLSDSSNTRTGFEPDASLKATTLATPSSGKPLGGAPKEAAQAVDIVNANIKINEKSSKIAKLSKVFEPESPPKPTWAKSISPVRLAILARPKKDFDTIKDLRKHHWSSKTPNSSSPKPSGIPKLSSLPVPPFTPSKRRLPARASATPKSCLINAFGSPSKIPQPIKKSVHFQSPAIEETYIAKNNYFPSDGTIHDTKLHNHLSLHDYIQQVKSNSLQIEQAPVLKPSGQKIVAKQLFPVQLPSGQTSHARNLSGSTMGDDDDVFTHDVGFGVHEDVVLAESDEKSKIPFVGSPKKLQRRMVQDIDSLFRGVEEQKADDEYLGQTKLFDAIIGRFKEMFDDGDVVKRAGLINLMSHMVEVAEEKYEQ